MKRAKGNLLFKSISWDTDTTSYDVDVFLTPACGYTAKAEMTDCDGIASRITKHFRTWERCKMFIDSLDTEAVEA